MDTEGRQDCPDCGKAEHEGDLCPGAHDRATQAVSVTPRSEGAPRNDSPPHPLRTRRPIEGEVLDGTYAIGERIGRGGMGAVYAARHLRFDRDVAIKVLLRGGEPGGSAHRRFLREARVASRLSHPNIVQIYDLGTLQDGSPYMVMERLRGMTLRDLLERDGMLSPAQTVALAAQVLSALCHAHDGRVVHRDLKPDNIFLHATRNEAPRAKLLDFGISKNLLDSSAALTRTGAIVGTPYYLSPEQASGQSVVDARADLWSLGVVMYECLTGALPFNGPSYATLLLRIIEERPAPPRMLRPQLPAALDALVTKALERAPEDRFVSAPEMLDALRNIEQGDADWHRTGVRAKLEERLPDDTLVDGGPFADAHDEIDRSGVETTSGAQILDAR